MAEVIFKIIKKFMIYSRMHIFIEGSENCDFLDNLEKFVRKFVKYQEYHGGFYTAHSTGLSLGNQVDGLPGALQWSFLQLEE